MYKYLYRFIIFFKFLQKYRAIILLNNTRYFKSINVFENILSIRFPIEIKEDLFYYFF